MRISIVPLLIIAVLSSGCATLPKPSNLPATTPKTTPAPSPERLAQLRNLKHWTLQASLGIRTPQEGVNASVHWQQQNSAYQLQIFGPLGTHRVELNGTPQQVILVREGVSYSATNAENLLKQQVGWGLPVSDLVYWIRGLPAPQTTSHASWDQDAHLVQLTQQGWHISYADYITVDHLDLPRKIILNHSQLQVRLIIQQWKI